MDWTGRTEIHEQFVMWCSFFIGAQVPSRSASLTSHVKSSHPNPNLIIHGLLSIDDQIRNSGPEKIAWLQEISAAAIGNTVPFGSLMLPEDDPRVVDAFNQLERRGMSEDDIKTSLTDGASWPQTHSKHQEARKQLGERLQLEAGQHRVVA